MLPTFTTILANYQVLGIGAVIVLLASFFLSTVGRIILLVVIALLIFGASLLPTYTLPILNYTV